MNSVRRVHAGDPTSPGSRLDHENHGCQDPNELSISVAMTTYQGARYLRQQLDSILGQSRLPDEIVISDDASTDRTWEILRDTAHRSPVPVRLSRQDHRVGLRSNVTAAMSLCTGSVIALADQDDVWMPGKLSAVAAAFADPAVTLWFSDASLVDEKGAAIGLTAWQAAHFTSQDQQSVSSGRGLRRLLHGMTVTGATMAVRSDVVAVGLPLPAQVGGADYLYLHDGWMAVLADLMGAIVTDTTPYTAYRQHAAQFTGRSMAREGEDPGRGEKRGRGELWTSRVAQLALESAKVSLVAERVRDLALLQACRREAVEELFALDSFLRVRMLPSGTLKTRQVTRQLLLGNYSRFARGLPTAIKDLTYSTVG